jgi:hydrogenase maturation protease
MARRILVAGIGNIFFGDDGFGVEVARRLAERAMPEGVEVADFGIRGMDLAFALMDEYDSVILVDAAARGYAPGTLSIIEHDWDAPGAATIEAHAMDPVKVLRFAREMGAKPKPTYIVACEPEFIGGGGEGYEDVFVVLSEAVKGALDEAVRMVESLAQRLSTAEGGELLCVGEPF